MSANQPDIQPPLPEDTVNIQVPAVTRPEAVQAFLNYDPEENPYNIRDDLENSSFPTTANLPVTPAARLMEMAMIHGDAEAIKHLDTYFIKFEMRRVPMDQIARVLDVSVSIARKFFNAYKERQRKYVERLEVNDVLARSLNALDEYESELYKLGTREAETTRNKIAALKAAAEMEMKKLESLERNRFYERKGYAANEAGAKDPSKKPQFLLNIMQNIFTGEDVEGDAFYKNMESDVLDVESESEDDKSEDAP